MLLSVFSRFARVLCSSFRFFLFISFLLKQDVLTDLIGLCAAHAYYFMADVYPLIPFSGRKSLVKAPYIL